MSIQDKKIEDGSAEQDCPAGDFSSWLEHTRHALMTNSGVDVSCGECRACCTSSYFIHIGPKETAALSRINKKILFPAPGLPKGNVLLGYLENGSCPMMTESGCSIYTSRPLTCRNYDCRIFAAAGIEAGGGDKARVSSRARRWNFSYLSSRGRDDHTAVQAAAAFMRDHADCFPSGSVPRNPSLLAVMAVKVYRVFLDAPQTRTDSETAQAVLDESAAFEALRDSN